MTARLAEWRAVVPDYAEDEEGRYFESVLVAGRRGVGYWVSVEEVVARLDAVAWDLQDADAQVSDP